MNPRIRDEALREAGAHLTRAIQALTDLGATGLALDTLSLANRVLEARRALRLGILAETRRDVDQAR